MFALECCLISRHSSALKQQHAEKGKDEPHVEALLIKCAIAISLD